MGVAGWVRDLRWEHGCVAGQSVGRTDLSWPGHLRTQEVAWISKGEPCRLSLLTQLHGGQFSKLKF